MPSQNDPSKPALPILALFDTFTTERLPVLAATFFPHGLALQVDPVRIVNDPAEDAVGDGGVADLCMPTGDRQLTGEQRGSCLVQVTIGSSASILVDDGGFPFLEGQIREPLECHSRCSMESKPQPICE
jgi:hypothetical protein